VALAIVSVLLFGSGFFAGTHVHRGEERFSFDNQDKQVAQDRLAKCEKMVPSDSLPDTILNYGETISLDFRTAQALGPKTCSRVDFYAPNYSGDNKVELDINGSEINQNIKLPVGFDSEYNFIYADIISIGRYLKSERYNGFVFPFCDGGHCNFGYGGTGTDNQADIRIMFRFENPTSQSINFQPGLLRLSSKGKVYKEWTIGTVRVEPYSDYKTGVQVYVPIELTDFQLEYVGG
jgi:hypothetical protein